MKFSTRKMSFSLHFTKKNVFLYTVHSIYRVFVVYRNDFHLILTNWKTTNNVDRSADAVRYRLLSVITFTQRYRLYRIVCLYIDDDNGIEDVVMWMRYVLCSIYTAVAIVLYNAIKPYFVIHMRPVISFIFSHLLFSFFEKPSAPSALTRCCLSPDGWINRDSY